MSLLRLSLRMADKPPGLAMARWLYQRVDAVYALSRRNFKIRCLLHCFHALSSRRVMISIWIAAAASAHDLPCRATI